MHYQLLACSVLFQAISALFTDFTSDWDEAGNYWEPLHFMIYGRGLQTWEWNPQHALRSPLQPLVLSLFGRTFKWIGLNKYLVFYLIRCIVGIVGSVSVYYFTCSIKTTFGHKVAFLTFLLTIFNENVLFFMNRINMDATMSILNMFIFSFWLEHRILLFIFTGVLTVMLRVNYLPIFGLMSLHLLFTQKNSSIPFTRWALHLIGYGLGAVLFWVSVFVIVDSYWYNKPTLAFFNFLWFNVVQNQSDMFGIHSAYKYLDCFIRDNNLIIFIGGIMGWIVTPLSLKFYAVPYLLSFCYLQMMSHKQERFVWYMYPILCLYSSVLLDWISQLSYRQQPASIRLDDTSYVVQLNKDSKVSRRHVAKTTSVNTPATVSQQQNSSKSYVNVVLSTFTAIVLIFYCVSGVSTTLLRVYQHKAHYDFYKLEVDPLVTSPSNCMSAMPWSSWWLPDNCHKIYTIQLYDEFFPGYNRASFTRFENPQEWALIPVVNSSKLFREEQIEWNDSVQLKRFFDLSKHINFYSTQLETAPIHYIFIQGGNSISNNTRALFKSITGKDPRHEKQSSILYYYETLLNGYLLDNFELVKEGYPLGYFFDVSPLNRQLGLWTFGSGAQQFNDSRIATLSFWRRTAN